jgi:hypothetical protein
LDVHPVYLPAGGCAEAPALAGEAGAEPAPAERAAVLGATAVLVHRLDAPL